AQAEFAIDRAGPAAQPAAEADADAVARPQLRLGRLTLAQLQRLELVLILDKFRRRRHRRPRVLTVLYSWPTAIKPRGRACRRAARAPGPRRRFGCWSRRSRPCPA